MSDTGKAAPHYRSMIIQWCHQNKERCPEVPDLQEKEHLGEGSNMKIFIFEMTITIDGDEICCEGEATSKKKSIRDAAKKLWTRMQVVYNARLNQKKANKAGKKKNLEHMTPPGEDDEEMTGTCVDFESRRGCGWIMPEGKEAKNERVFVHWKDINSEDAWPKLQNDLEVRFVLKHFPEDQAHKWRATGVSNLDGSLISLNEEGKKYSKKAITGKVSSYSKYGGFGKIEIAKKVNFGGETVEKGGVVNITREDLVCKEDTACAVNLGTEVRFHLYVVEKANKEDDTVTMMLYAGRVTQKDGQPIEFVAPTKEEKAAYRAEKKKRKLEADETEETSAKKQRVVEA